MEFTSSGSSGHPKIIYRPANDHAIPLPDEIDRLVRTHSTVFVHSKRHQLESFYWILDKTYRKEYHVEPVEYHDLDSTIGAVKQGDVVCIYEYPSAFFKFLFFIKKGIEQKLITKQEMAQKKLIVEISGEPLTVGDLEYIIAESCSIFGSEPILWVTYGLAEVGGVAYCDYRREKPRVAYEIAEDRVFVEAIDPVTGWPSVGRRGEIIITALRTNGTILVRYRTGDVGILRFDGDKPLLEELDRPSSVFVAGSQFSVQGITRDVREKFGVPAKLTVGRAKDTRRGTERLNVTVHVPTQNSSAQANYLERFVKERIVEEAELHTEITSGIVLIEVAISVESDNGESIEPLKSWRITQVQV